MDVSLRNGSIKLMEQVLEIEGVTFRLIVPQDVEAVMEMYIEAGAPQPARTRAESPALVTGIARDSIQMATSREGPEQLPWCAGR